MIRFLWALHNHQPVGNFGFIFERAYGRAYAPFLRALERHAGARISLHFSGILLEWLEDNHPEYLEALGDLVRAGRVEILGGAYYEPVLPAIPDRDKVGQIRRLQEAVFRLFGVVPRGMWLAERVWEPSLAAPIAEAGMDYVVLDGHHFKQAGLQDAELDGWFLAEEQGRSVKLLPIHDGIRDMLPFRPVDELVGVLLGRQRGSETQIVFGDDGEKFGDWPGTQTTVYEAGWLDSFLDAADGSAGALALDRLDAGFAPGKCRGLVYPPPASYPEMGEWALAPRELQAFRTASERLGDPSLRDGFLRRGMWRNFLIKYPESNRLHKQAQRLSALAAELPDTVEPARREEARESVWRAQCNCAYWHGVSGGLYLPHLRHALYRNLIRAREIVDEAVLPPEGMRWESGDWNCDGFPEWGLCTRRAYLEFNGRGEIEHFWLKGAGLNLADALARRPEPYHDGLPPESPAAPDGTGDAPGIWSGTMIYDRRPRNFCADRFLEAHLGLNRYLAQDFEEVLEFRTEEVDTALSRHGARIVYKGRLWDAGGSPRASLEKTYLWNEAPRAPLGKPREDSAPSGSLKVGWRLRALEGGRLRFRLASELLFCLLAGRAPDRYIIWREPGGSGREHRDFLASRGEMPDCRQVEVFDSVQKVHFLIEHDGASSWRDCLETLSHGWGGRERVYQGTVVAPVFDLELSPGESLQTALTINLKEGI